MCYQVISWENVKTLEILKTSFLVNLVTYTQLRKLLYIYFLEVHDDIEFHTETNISVNNSKNGDTQNERI